jgi:hypothetical protein
MATEPLPLQLLFVNDCPLGVYSTPELADAACTAWAKKNPDKSELFIRSKVLDAPPEL